MNLDPPYPRIGEALRFLAGALDVKRRNRAVDRLAREGDFDWEQLPQLIDELIREPLARQIDPAFSELVGQWLAFFQGEYIRVLRTISLDALSREDALPLLQRHLFSAWVANLLVLMKHRFGGQDLHFLLAPSGLGSSLLPDINPIDAVLLNAEHSAGLDGGALTNLFYRIHDRDPRQRDQIERWRKGKQLPDVNSLIAGLDAWDRLKAMHPRLPARVDVLRWLIVARAICWAERRSPALRRNIASHLDDLEKEPIDIGPYFSEAIARAAVRAGEAGTIGLDVMDSLSLQRTKEPGALAEVDALLDRMMSIFDRAAMPHATEYWRHWCLARRMALCGDFEDAMPHYLKAADLALYRCGQEQKGVLREAVYLAAHLGKAVHYKKLMHRCLAIEMVPRPFSVLESRSWIPMEYYARWFESVFPKSGRFPERYADQDDGAANA
jgi:hypothetical protein